MPEDFRNDTANFMRAVKQKVLTQKEARGIRVEEGKVVMSFDCYHKLCKLMFECGDDESVFGQIAFNA